MAEAKRKYEAHPQSAPGDFYVLDGVCFFCGAPETVAPALIGWADVNEDECQHCIWKKQPETPEELEQAFAAFDASCCEGYRYAGADATIIARLPTTCCDQVEQHEAISNPEYWKQLFENIRRRQSIENVDE